ncbi:MAG: hypothetical protein IPP40_12000 [bacterium]|nr:hypothetical protein [bacterium]
MKWIWWMAIALAFSRVVSMYSFYLYDDAFITFRYTANLVSGHGLVYNIGERVQGITTPIWGFVLAIPASIGVPLEIASRWLGLLFDLLSLVLIWRIFSWEQNGYSGMLVAFLFVVDLFLAKTSVSGMEAPLLLFVMLLAIDSYQRDKLYSAAVLSGLTVFVRPEGLLFAISLLIYATYVKRKLQLGPMLAGIALIVVGAILQYAYYGQWIPQSVVGKAALERNYDWLLSLALFPIRDPLQFVLSLTTIAGLPTAWRRSEFVRIYSLWTIALLFAWTITGAHLWAWYCYPVWFWKALVTGVFICAVFEKSERIAWIRKFTVPAVLCGFTMIGWTALAVALGPSDVSHNIQSKIAGWAKSRDFSGKTTYGMDFGVFGYYTGMRVIDEPGLVWPDAITKYASHEILLGERPEYAFVNFGQWTELARLYRPQGVAGWRGADSGERAERGGRGGGARFTAGEVVRRFNGRAMTFCVTNPLDKAGFVLLFV